MNKILTRQFHRAKAEGRVCERCGWMITVLAWAKGFRMCPGCYDALKGVNVDTGQLKYRDEPIDRTGNMP